MMKHQFKIYSTLSLFIILLFQCLSLLGQGCSDAGFCTLGGLSGQSKIDERKSSIGLISTFGKGENGVTIFNPNLFYRYHVNERLSLQVKIGWNAATKNESVNGLSDVFFVGDYILFEKKQVEQKVTLGFKCATNKANLGNNLPMVYQSSLGTNDIIFGYSIHYKNISSSIGLQMPLNNPNENSYFIEETQMGLESRFPNTNQFTRKPDVLFRIDYHYNKFEKVNLNVGILSIYHIKKDSYYNPSIGMTQEIKSSKGSTINITAGAIFKIGKFNIGVMGGFPIKTRKSRPDGLTRLFVISPEITYKF